MKEKTEQSPREILTGILSRLHEDTDFSQEDVLFGHILTDYEAYAELIEADMAQREYDKEKHRLRSENEEQSLQALSAWAEQNAVDAGRTTEALDYLRAIATSVNDGRYTEEHLQMALHAMDYDDAVSRARTEGEIAGRNSRIEELLAAPSDSDGIPILGGSAAKISPAGESCSIFDLARGSF